MSRAGRWSLVLLCAGLAVFGLLQPDPRRQLSATTFGVGPTGFGALYDTLLAVDVPVARSYALPDALPVDGTVWWLEPDGLCVAADVGPPTAEEALEGWQGAEWIAAGGTAIIAPRVRDGCAFVAGIPLPARLVPDSAAILERNDRPDAAEPHTQTMRGPLTPRPRRLEVPELATFADAGDFTVIASIGERPFALERQVGAGRLVAVADPRFLRNQWLDGGDAAVLAVDFVRTYGTPRFDERVHGLRRVTHPVRYLVRSPALPLLLGLVVLGLLFVWRGQLTPARTLPAAQSNVPTLVAFVDSMAELFAGTGDHASVLERYRALSAARLRRHFHLPPETPLAALIDRLRASHRASDADLAQLAATTSAGGGRELTAALNDLDALVHAVTR